MSNSEEEEIARDYICFSKPDLTVVILDATCLEKCLNLVYQTMEITKNIIVCVNLLDEAEKKGISIDLEKLSFILGVPVVGTIARKKKTISNLLSSILFYCENTEKRNPNLVKYEPFIESAIHLLETPIKQNLSKENQYLSRWISLKLLDGDSTLKNRIMENLLLKNDFSFETYLTMCNDILKENNSNPNSFKEYISKTFIQKSEETAKAVIQKQDKQKSFDLKLDKILTSKKFGIPIMLAFLGVILWLTIVGANYPSQLLSQFFAKAQLVLENFLKQISCPVPIYSLLVDGIYSTVTWIVSVMLPPMAIFFPLFTLLEDCGFLPRIAFNLDKLFCKAGSSGKQSLTMCMGFGCNAAGIIGCRIIDSPREKLISIITNAFVPCNGRFPFLITISSIFIGSYFSKGSSFISTLCVLAIILLGIFMTLVISKFLSQTFLKGSPSSFVLELPPYRSPQLGKVLVRSIFDRTLFVLARALTVAIPAGIFIWLLANLTIDNQTLLSYIANFFDPFAKLIGLDGYIFTAFLLGMPANEIVLPIILMCYMQTGNLVGIENMSSIATILQANGWTLLTAINVMIFTLLHFPCTTSLVSIYKETKSLKWTFLSFLLPTLCGIILCFFITQIYHLIFI